MNSRIDLKDVTFLIPLRVDTIERFENIKVVSEYLLSCFRTNIIVLEVDKRSSDLLKDFLPNEVIIFFEKDDNEIFHRTKYLNKLVRMATTPIIGIWDSDVIVNPVQIEASIVKLREGAVDFIYPYDGRFVETGVFYRTLFIDDLDVQPLESICDSMIAPYTTVACGGGFFANKTTYIKAGMENENFYGWGPEDGERLKRWKILEKRIIRVKGPMFHLSHPRGINSMFESEKSRDDLIGELERIGQMTKSELETEITTWGWLFNT